MGSNPTSSATRHFPLFLVTCTSSAHWNLAELHSYSILSLAYSARRFPAERLYRALCLRYTTSAPNEGQIFKERVRKLMQCPSCGFAIFDNQATVCPNCGKYLSTAATPENPSRGPEQGAAGAPPSYPAYPTYPSGYGQPSVPSQGYPVYPGGYGQPGMPSQGYPGYPGYPSGYGQPGLPPVPGAPKKTNQAGVIVSVVLAVVVVAGLLTAGLLLLSHPRASTGSNSGTTTASSGTSTPSLSPIFTDPLTSNANAWSSDTHCFFGSDGYHIKGGWICYAPTGIPNNFTAQVRVKRVSGPVGDGYGIAFRRVSTGSEYLFVIDGLGHWRVDKCVTDTCSTLIDWSSSGGAIHTAINSENTVEVDANGSHFDFFANGAKIGQLSDSTFTNGDFGLAGGSSSEVVFSSLVINQIV